METGTINLFDGADERSLMITVLCEWKGGYKNSINTVKMLSRVYREQTGIDCEPLIQELEDRVYALLFKNELESEQQGLDM